MFHETHDFVQKASGETFWRLKLSFAQLRVSRGILGTYHFSSLREHVFAKNNLTLSGSLLPLLVAFKGKQWFRAKFSVLFNFLPYFSGFLVYKRYRASVAWFWLHKRSLPDDSGKNLVLILGGHSFNYDLRPERLPRDFFARYFRKLMHGFYREPVHRIAVMKKQRVVIFQPFLAASPLKRTRCFNQSCSQAKMIA